MSPDVSKAFEVVKGQNQAGALFSDALDVLGAQFPLVRADLKPYFDALEVRTTPKRC